MTPNSPRLAPLRRLRRECPNPTELYVHPLCCDSSPPGLRRISSQPRDSIFRVSLPRKQAFESAVNPPQTWRGRKTDAGINAALSADRLIDKRLGMGVIGYDDGMQHVLDEQHKEHWRSRRWRSLTTMTPHCIFLSPADFSQHFIKLTRAESKTELYVNEVWRKI